MTSLDAIEIASIDITGRIRSVDPAQVEALKVSIAAVGLLNPVTVCPKEQGGYRLIAGGHRLAAAKELGLVDVPARIVTLGEYELVIAECDENLCGPRLSPAEKSLFMRRREEAFEALHGPAKANSARAANAAMGRGEDVNANLAATFTADTAAKTGESERVVQRFAERGAKVIPEVLDMIKGTKLDTGVYLDKLKKLPPNEQVAAARRDLAASKRADAVEKKASTPAAEEAVPEPEDTFDPLAVRAFSPAARDYGGLTADQRVDELEEHVAALEADIRGYVAELKLFRDMKVQFEQGGFDKVVAGKDEEIRVLKEQVYSESAAKIAAVKALAEMTGKRDYWMGWSKDHGWKPPSDKSAVPADYDDAFMAAVTEAEG